VPQKLSPEHREVIDLVYYHEQSVEDVARIVGIPEATMKTRMFYTRLAADELARAVKEFQSASNLVSFAAPTE
jgi:RNA polymerase sigma-70 factor (ECF subfamily)